MAFIPPTLPAENYATQPTAAMVVPAYEVQWNRPVFRAPALQLPTKAQIWSEVPFTAHFKGKARTK